jgi:hypothetical protein
MTRAALEGQSRNRIAASVGSSRSKAVFLENNQWAVSKSRAVTLLYGFLSAMWWSKMLHASPSKTFRSRSKMPLKDHRSHWKIVMFQFTVVSEDGWKGYSQKQSHRRSCFALKIVIDVIKR